MFRPAVSRSFHPNWARGQLPAHPHNASRPFDGLLSGLFSACSHQPTPKERQRQHPNAWKKCGVNSISESRLGRRSGRPLSQRRRCARSTEYCVWLVKDCDHDDADYDPLDKRRDDILKFRGQQQFQLIYATYSAPRDPHEGMMDKFNCSVNTKRTNGMYRTPTSQVSLQTATAKLVKFIWVRRWVLAYQDWSIKTSLRSSAYQGRLHSLSILSALVQDATVVPKTSTFQDVHNMAKVDLDKNRDIETSLRT
uniref:Uncharacterized protein n=1 Tax=Coccidioides posadasii RMSCC 3488 TaxID=454284 RepID=A0A0J6F0E2_COCPO|nr:hypothetical protein CPAG_02685 [Coccidioides posadasii RMSCC 3488]